LRSGWRFDVFNTRAREGTEGFALDESTFAPLDPERGDTATEHAFFERGALEERATIEALARGPARADARRRIRRRSISSMLAGTAGLAALALAAFLVAGRPARRPRRRLVITAPALVVEAPPPPADPAPPPPADPAPPPPGDPAPAPAAAERAAPAPPVGATADACRAAVAARRFREMLAVCDDAAGRVVDGAALALLVANTELDRGKTTSALTWARRAVASDPRLADGYVIIGSAEQAAGRRGAARAAYGRYLALAPDGRYAAELRAITRGW
jgi:hypothetical protein